MLNRSFAAMGVPNHYFQVRSANTYNTPLLPLTPTPRPPLAPPKWDDWVDPKENNNDNPGITSWWPREDVFPSGLTNWLDTPTSLYAPMYAADNVWTNYTWKTAAGCKSAIPLDPAFYDALFANGSRAQMVMFEQDFLCTYNLATPLTSSDLTSGATWLTNMDRAAHKANISLQWCMCDPRHILFSTTAHRVTNARATKDNTRATGTDVMVLPLSSILHAGLGIFPSRDNVWTTSLPETHCHRASLGLCTEPSPEFQNTAAVMSGGPYGHADKLGMVNRTMVFRAIRQDGLLLRPDRAAYALDESFRQSFASLDIGQRLVSATYSAVGGQRFSYVLGYNLSAPFVLPVAELFVGAGSPHSVVTFNGWQQNGTLRFADLQHVSATGHMTLGAAYETDPRAVGGTYTVVAPVLGSSNSWALLGEVDKFIAVSSRRFSELRVDAAGALSTAVRVVPGETVVVSVAHMPSTRLITAACSAHGSLRHPASVDEEVAMTLLCQQTHSGPASSMHAGGSSVTCSCS